jgi:hypothetical protein
MTFQTDRRLRAKPLPPRRPPALATGGAVAARSAKSRPARVGIALARDLQHTRTRSDVSEAIAATARLLGDPGDLAQALATALTSLIEHDHAHHPLIASGEPRHPAIAPSVFDPDSLR